MRHRHLAVARAILIQRRRGAVDVQTPALGNIGAQRARSIALLTAGSSVMAVLPALAALAALHIKRRQAFGTILWFWSCQ
jgi:hypothetical protein